MADVISSTRERILIAAMSLMSERGVKATSMRELGTAAGVNVASIYHYFPSKKDLVDAVICERGDMAARTRLPTARRYQSVELEDLMSGLLTSMLEVEEFVRLMMAETIQDGETAGVIGLKLFTSFKEALESWLVDHDPQRQRADAAVGEAARLLCAVIIGTTFEYLAGALETNGETVTELLRNRAAETVRVLNKANWP